MAYESNFMTLIGNLVEDPELRFTQGGTEVCGFRMAWNRKYQTKDGQDQEETLFMTVNVWRDLANNVAESLTKGDRVLVIGRLRSRSYEAKDGTTRWVYEIEADEVAPSLRWATARPQRSSGGGGGGGSSTGSGDPDIPPPPNDDDVPF